MAATARVIFSRIQKVEDRKFTAHADMPLVSLQFSTFRYLPPASDSLLALLAPPCFSGPLRQSFLK